MKELLFEIGTEEIPSNFLSGLIRGLEELAGRLLTEGRLGFKGLRTLGAPRRLVLHVEELAEAQEPLITKVFGPAERVAFKEGRPTRAAEGFARGQGVSLEKLKIEETERGRYLFVERREEGKETGEFLKELLPRLVRELPSPKSMRWGEGELRFVRPIHWFACVFGSKVIEFELGGIKSSGSSRGHRFLSPGVFSFKNFRDYLQKAGECFVMVEPEERRARIAELIEEKASELGGEALEDPELLETVTNLVEWPVAVAGSFDSKFLSLPKEVLISSLRDHQRCFSVVGPGGKLLAHFISISNTSPQDEAVVRAGNERVVRARLADADFFFHEDLKHPLEHFREALKGVIFQADLGTSFEKAERIERLALFLAEKLHAGDGEVFSMTRRAAQLCKADLTTHMVGEFPELQGVMGREYARLQGEGEEVARAIWEHYLPRSAEDEFPGRGPGALIGMADRLDTIAGYVGLGITPTGSEDPFGLRRSARALLGTLRVNGYRVELHTLAGEALRLLQGKVPRSGEEVQAQILDFLRTRLHHLFLGEGYRYDLVDAVLSARFEDVVEAEGRLRALSGLSREEGFEALTTTFKRVVNIIHQSGVLSKDDFRGTLLLSFPVESSLFSEPTERELFGLVEESRGDIEESFARESWEEALGRVAGLRKTVDKFFDDVLVMAPEERVKENRLNLLATIGAFFTRIADFSKIVSG